MSIDLAQFIPTFLEESFEGLEVMESGLLNLDTEDAETINAIFRAAHSIKGGAGTFGFTDITDFTHVVETLMDELRAERRAFTDTLKNLLLSSVDCIRLLLEAARDNTECNDPQVDQVFKQLEMVLAGGEVVLTHADNEKADSTHNLSSENDNLPENVSSAGEINNSGWHIEFKPAQHLLMTGNEPILMMAALAECGEFLVHACTANVPALLDLNPEELFLVWDMDLYSDCDEAVVREVFEWVEDDCELTITPIVDDNRAVNSQSDSLFQEHLADFQNPQGDVPVSVQDEAPVAATITTESVAPEASVSITAAERAEMSSVAKSQDNVRKSQSDAGSIRVGIDKIDGLINRVGELVITQSMLGQVGSELADLEHPAVDRLNDGLLQLERNTRDLQEEVMRIRMLPISFVFNRFPRLVHDVSSQLGKEVELKLSGEQTELDKTVMEKIGDPLLHLVRNALDHGLETPQERVAAGKSECGTLDLNAYHQGGFIIIQIKDDGRGLDTQRIREKALENGLISSDQVLSEADIHDLIFLPGFSTAVEVNGLSGRGVGMDVVRRNIESLGGHVSVTSEAGIGSSFTVTLPLTLAILDGQLIKLQQEAYIIPLVSIVESIWVSAEALNAVAGQGRLFLFRDEYVPVIHLSSLFGFEEYSKDFSSSLMVIVEGGGKKAGLIVDELQGQQQVVIKSLETNYKRVDGFFGATILGNGQVALILDVASLIKMGLDNANKKQPRRHKNNDEAQQMKVRV
ncbi:chemotaxis protein CheA [Neptunomonas qingdaonensis]|uniref:Chemotaxis protein CheA n=1 Tax=Neptunomonas qingdaonensis TaxID=1045558 RepID=A0A1I2U780_9GAMM|nr:chemotaxis protein CheA [Neptunomonas qingdaonensis]SFG72992.1 two-component system, chemotaxis family, sensor kinase CheA [Neptunomonas qingdaonensis]